MTKTQERYHTLDSNWQVDMNVSRTMDPKWYSFPFPGESSDSCSDKYQTTVTI